MGEHNEADDDPAKTDYGDDYRGPMGDLYWVVGSAGIAFVCLLLAALFWPNLTERTKFFTGNLWNLVIAFAVIAQVIIYRKQWGVMDRGLQRQEAALTQWIEIQPDGIHAYYPASKDGSEVTMDLRWKVLNNTQLPLTFRKAQIDICRIQDWETFEIEDNAIIPPHFVNRHYYKFFVPLHLNKDETKELKSDGVELSVAIRIIWIDALGREQIQAMGDLYRCTPSKMEINESLGKGAEFIRIDKGDDESDFIVTEIKTVSDSRSKKRRG